MPDMVVFLNAVDTFLAEKGFDPHKHRTDQMVTGHDFRHAILIMRQSACSVSGQCVDTSVKALLGCMKSITGWSTENTESALVTAGFDPQKYIQ